MPLLIGYSSVFRSIVRFDKHDGRNYDRSRDIYLRAESGNWTELSVTANFRSVEHTRAKALAKVALFSLSIV